MIIVPQSLILPENISSWAENSSNPVFSNRWINYYIVPRLTSERRPSGSGGYDLAQKTLTAILWDVTKRLRHIRKSRSPGHYVLVLYYLLLCYLISFFIWNKQNITIIVLSDRVRKGVIWQKLQQSGHASLRPDWTWNITIIVLSDRVRKGVIWQKLQQSGHASLRPDWTWICGLCAGLPVK